MYNELWTALACMSIAIGIAIIIAVPLLWNFWRTKKPYKDGDWGF